MSYIGNTQNNQNYVPAVDFFSGNGSTTAFTLSRPVASVAAVQAVINNVPQNPGDAFSVLNNTITFTSAPPSGTNNIYVYYTSPNTQVVQPGQGTVGTNELAAGGVTPAKLSTGGMYWDTASNVGVGTNSPQVYSGYTVLSVDNTTNGGVLAMRLNGTALLNLWTAAGEGRIEGANNAAITFRTVSTERGRFDTSGNFLFNSGYGSVATAYGCRAWVNFNGTGTVAIRGSGNVTSITDNGTGDYTVNFTNAMPDGNYAWSAVAGKVSARDCFVQPVPDTTPTWSTTAFRMVVWSSTGSAQTDTPYVSAMVIR